MNIPSTQIQYQKRIGRVGSKGVIEIGLVGGFKIVGVQSATGKISTLGTGSHRGIARFLAKRAEPELVIDDLEKAEELTYREIEPFLPFWQGVTNAVKLLRNE